MLLNRKIINKINEALESIPVTTVLGARQVGKSTLVRHILQRENSVYLDLESPTDCNGFVQQSVCY